MHHLQDNVSVPTPGSSQVSFEGLAAVWIFLNVDLMEPICGGFGCSEAIGTDTAGVIVVPVGEDNDLMYGSVVWGILQRAYAQ